LYEGEVAERAPERKREAVLDAALELFAERGYHGTSVPEVAEAAAVGAGTIYRFFESKEELVNALYRRTKMRLMARLLADHPFGAPARDQFAVFWRRLAQFARLEADAFAFLELHHHSPYLDDESRALERDALTPVAEFLAHARTRGEVRDAPVEVLIAVVWGAFVSLVKADRLGYVALDGALLAEAESAVWAALAGPGPKAQEAS
jgi:AcrR family transcriptional regulator